MTDKRLEIIIPILDEEDTIALLYDGIEKAMGDAGNPEFRVIFVDDGSRDDSWQRITELVHARPGNITAIKLRRNFGKSAALAAGIAETSGDIIITMDADLQDDPAEISNFLAKLADGHDMVVGWKKDRKDPAGKTVPSRLFNAVTRCISGLAIHDFNCGFKAARRPVFESMRIYGELHRFIPVMAHNKGFRVTEIVVTHHPRRFGKSKYGLKRFVPGFLDLMTMLAITRFSNRPGHFFGGIGLVSGVLGAGMLLYLTGVKFIGGENIGQRPLLLFGILLVILSVQMLSLGVLAELLTRNSTAGSQAIEAEIVINGRNEGDQFQAGQDHG